MTSDHDCLFMNRMSVGYGESECEEKWEWNKNVFTDIMNQDVEADDDIKDCCYDDRYDPWGE